MDGESFVEVPLQGWFLLQFFSAFSMVTEEGPVPGAMCGPTVILLLHGLVCIMIHSAFMHLAANATRRTTVPR